MFTALVLLGLEGPQCWWELGKACLFSPSSGPAASGDVLTGMAVKEQEGGPQATRPSCHCREETTPKASTVKTCSGHRSSDLPPCGGFTKFPLNR